MQNKFIIAGNWKMHGTKDLARQHIAKLSRIDVQAQEIIIFPPYTLLHEFADSDIHYGAQDCDHRDNGAHTGQISAEMLKDIGCRYVLLGHSERRQAGESSALIQDKASAATAKKLKPIICIGESEEDKRAGNTLSILEEQIISSIDFQHEFIIAYEPVWAIGTGLTPEFSEVNDIHKWIKEMLLAKTGKDIKILYGGSVNRDNISTIKEQSDINGVLVGGASIDIDHFMQIIV